MTRLIKMKHMTCLLTAWVFLGFGQCATAQEDELELIEKVERLQEKLDSQSIDERNAAEKELVELGVGILDYLRPADRESTTDYRERVLRIRKKLEKKSVNSVALASRASISGTYAIAEVLKKIKNQTGNEIAVPDAIAGNDVTLKVQDGDFWTLLNQFMKNAELEIDRYGSEKPNQLMLVPRDRKPAKPLPTCSAKIFQSQVTRVDSSVNLDDESLDFTSINLLVRWEPRLTPIAVDIPLSNIQILDEFGESIQVKDPERVLYGTVQPEIPEVEFQLQIPRIERQVENIKSLKAQIIAVIPGRTEQFRFNDIRKLKTGKKISKAGAVVTYGGTRKNEELFGIKISLSFDEANNALESHQGWAFQNEVYLQDRQGNREEALSMETFRQDNEMITIQYYFLNDPGKRTLVYKTPATIVKMPVEIELKKIPLP